jgi:hypothetical protein
MYMARKSRSLDTSISFLGRCITWPNTGHHFSPSINFIDTVYAHPPQTRVRFPTEEGIPPRHNIQTGSKVQSHPIQEFPEAYLQMERPENKQDPSPCMIISILDL